MHIIHAQVLRVLVSECMEVRLCMKAKAVTAIRMQVSVRGCRCAKKRASGCSVGMAVFKSDSKA